MFKGDLKTKLFTYFITETLNTWSAIWQDIYRIDWITSMVQSWTTTTLTRVYN